MRVAAIYARVSSEQQKEENTIASQTAALIDFAREQGYSVPDDWMIEDEGFSGASLLRPGLERLRDLAAEGHIQAVLIHSPDRLSRKYAYQVLLTEEFARHGVETIFLKAPHSGTPEDQLMLQFQGIIAKYERAQILERSRRGKRHRAKAGEVSVLGGAPYGYRYIRKTSEAPARYQIDAAAAEVVRLVYDKYPLGGLSIGAIARLLHGMGVPTRRRVRWERSVVWAILRNPAYKGTACFNKTQTGPRQKLTKPFRLSGRAVHGDKSSSHERPLTNGSRSRSRRLSAKRPSLWQRSGWLTTGASHPAGPSSPASSKDWYPAANAAMRCRGRRPVPPRAKSITPAVSAPTLGAISAGRCATAGRSVKTCSTRSCGREVFTSFKHPPLFQRNPSG